MAEIINFDEHQSPANDNDDIIANNETVSVFEQVKRELVAHERKKHEDELRRMELKYIGISFLLMSSIT